MISRESTLNINNPLQGHSFASFLLGAPASGVVDVNPKPHYQWFFMAPWIQDDWRVNSKLTLNLGFRWDINGSVTEENNMLNYAFDPTIVNPVSARVQGPPVMGGIRFAGVNGAPDRPWKLDKDNWQGRVGMAYSLNEKTVLRAGYGKYFLNPTSQGNNAGFSLGTQLIESTDGGRTPTYRLSNPWPNGIQTPPGSALGPETFLGRGPNFSNPDFVVPNVHQFSVGVQRELPWRVSVEATYAGSRSYDLEGGFGAYNEPSAAFQAQCDVTQGGSRTLCDQQLPNPYFGVAGFEGTNAVHGPDALTVRTESPVPRVFRHHPEPEQHRQADLRLGAVRREQALGEGRDHQRQLYVCAEVDGDRRLRRCGLGTAERYRVFLAPPTSRHGVRRVGAAVVPRREEHRWLPARRLVDRAGARLPVRPAVGHARQRRSGAGRQPRRHRAVGQEGRAVHLRRQAVHRRVQREHAPIRSGVGLDRVRVHRAVLPDSPERSSAAPR